MKRCIMLLIDGLRPDVLESEMVGRNLPGLASMSDGGSRLRATSVFPTTTSVAYLPFLTGCLPGRCNVPSIRWIDRAAYRGRWWRDREAVRSYCGYQAGRLDADIAPEIATIFDLVPESIAVWSMINRGLAPERNIGQGSRKFWGTVSHYTERYQRGDAVVARAVLDAVEGDARFIFAQFPGVDGHTHADRPDGERTLGSLYQVDRLVSEILHRLRTRGILEDTLMLVVSDHGASVMHHHFDLAEWLESLGVPTLRHPVIWRKRPRAAVMVAGNAAAAIYARPGSGDLARLTFDQLRRPEAFGIQEDIVSRLLEHPGVALLAAENGEGGLRIAAADGEADLSRTAGGIRYSPRSGDPLRVGGAFEDTDRAYLSATLDGPFPDAATHLLDQFTSPRAGDLVLAANEGWDFRDQWEVPEHKSGHGSLVRSHILTPLWSNKPLADRPWRTVDLFPTILEWLGVTVPEGIDGVSRPS